MGELTVAFTVDISLHHCRHDWAPSVVSDTTTNAPRAFTLRARLNHSKMAQSMSLRALWVLLLLGAAGLASASDTNPAAAALQRTDKKKADPQGHKKRTSTHKAGKGHVHRTICMCMLTVDTASNPHPDLVSPT